MTVASLSAAKIESMMTQQLHVSILAAPLAAIDPRALSQAWYSALRLAHDTPAFSNTSGECVTASRPRATIATAALREADRNPAVVAPRSPRCTRGELRGVAGDYVKRRAARAPLARRIERAFAASTPPQRATFSLGQGAARVHVILQTSGDRSALVALCRPELEAIVSRALAQAGQALAARGIVVEMRARGVTRCS
jgi:hypothetical protein